MNIAVFIKSTTFHEGYGGLETQNKNLCEALVKKGHSVSVFSPAGELKELEKENNGVFYHFVPCVYRLGFIPSSNNWINKSVDKFKELHQENKFDLVLSQSSSGLGIIKKKHELGVKIVSISHGTILGEFKTKLKELSSFKEVLSILRDSVFVLRVYFGRQRAFVHGSDRVIAVSNGVKNALINETFVDEKKVSVVFNGIDPERYSRRPGKFGKPHLIYLGRIIKSKGSLILVDLVKDLNCILDVVGDGEAMPDLKNKVESLDLAQKIILHGKVRPDQVPGSLLRSDIFVFPTLRVEGLPMVLVEAMFAGLPIVAFDMGGVSDVVEDGVNGFLLKEGDLDGFGMRLSELVENSDLRSAMSQASLTKAENQFTLDNMVRMYENVFSEVLSL